MSDEVAKVQFTVRCNMAIDPKEDTVCILGNAPQLGSWKHTMAVPMTRVEADSTTNEQSWSVSIELPVQKPVEYKYVLRHQGAIAIWETITGNRTVMPGANNFALGKPCRQSSTYEALKPPVPGLRVAEAANNGNTNGYHEWMCCHTKKEKQPWWEVDLEADIPITSIVLWNRQDRMTARLFPCWILIGKTPFSDTATLEEAKSCAVVAKKFENIKRTNEWIFASGEQYFGRYVRVQLEGENFLHFAELEVYHAVDFHRRNACRLYSYDDEDHPDFKPRTDKRDYYAPCEDDAIEVLHKIDDGLFGLDSRDSADESSDLHLRIDDGWLSSQTGSELRIILGSFAGGVPIHLVNQRPVVVEMRVEKDEHVHWPGTADAQVIFANTIAEDLFIDGESESSNEVASVKQAAASVVERHTPFTSQDSKTRARAESSLLDDDAEDEGTCPDLSIDVLSNDSLRKIDAFRSLDDALIDKIRSKMEKRSYSAGEALIRHGDARNSMFIIDEGEVTIVGQNTIVGERVLKTLGRGSAVGEMALLGGGIRTATVRATTHTVCYRLCRQSFVSALGKVEHNRLREELLKESMAVPISSSIARWDNDTQSMKYEDSQNRKPIDKDDIQVFRVRIKALEHVKSRFMLDVFTADSNHDLIGTVYLLPSQFHRSNGCLTAPIISMGASQLGRSPIVGQCLLRYVVINPLVHPENNLSVVWRNHWVSKPTLDVGHRGLGRSYHQVAGYRSATIKENTLVSFMVAGELGADYIEFDVQLTRDRVPVIYHDFWVEVGLEDLSEESKGEHYYIGIHELTARHLDRCRIDPVPKKNFMFQRLVNKHWKKLVKGSKSRRSTSPSRAVDPYLSHLIDTFPRLKHVLECVPQKVGLNVEIKYPTEKTERSLRDLPAFEMNSYLDSILKTIFDCAGSRRIIFSSFDPEVCIMLRAKQARYPVFFLTCAGTSLNYADARCLSIQSALLFAKMERLQGIVSNSEPLLNNPELIRAIKNEGLLLFTWGDKNSDHSNVQFQKMHGVDAVISDNVGDLTKLDGKAKKLDK